jgi:hypothetical protein
VKNQRKTITTEEELDAISQLEKGEQIVDICHNVRSLLLAYVQFVINVTGITGSAASETKVFV